MKIYETNGQTNVTSLVLLFVALMVVSSAETPEVGVAHLQGDTFDPSIHGFIYFVTLNLTHVWVWANVTGITNNPNNDHGLHVHSLGDITGPTAMNTGGHYIGVLGEDIHACEDSTIRHEGDMGNWTVDGGAILQSKTLDLLSLSGSYSIIGRAVVLHNMSDNCVATSSSGNRLAQGVIGIANPNYLPDDVAMVVVALFPSSPSNNASSGEESVTKAVAFLTPISNSAVSGLVTFEQDSNGVKVKANITSLNSPNAYGFHIHIYGDMNSFDGMSASTHYNPYNVTHSLVHNSTRHVGDLGNICSYGSDGFAYYEYTFTDLVILSGKDNIIGRSVIIHSIRDDGGSIYGSRIAQGVIGIGSSSTTNVTIPDGATIHDPTCAATILTSPEIGVAYLKGDSLYPSISGYVYFVTLNTTHVWVWVNISGLSYTDDITRGLHVHTFGDITSPTALNTGGHYFGVNENDVHACENTTIRHEGDMGNWVTENGTISQSKVLDLLSLTGTHSIIGRGVVLHNFTDNCVTTSSAGSRLAQGVIGIANPNFLPAEVAAMCGHTTSSSLNNATSGSSISKAVAVLTPISGSDVNGLVVFEQGDTGVTIQANVSGLSSTNTFGFHIHIYGDLNSTDGMAASSHYNPYNASHGIAPSPDRHVGDLGNICSYDSGFAYYNYTFTDLLTLNGINNIIGRNVIIHAIRDDGGSTYGTRVAQGVIGVASGEGSTEVTFPPTLHIRNPLCSPLETTSGTSSGEIFTTTTTTTTTATTTTGTTISTATSTTSGAQPNNSSEEGLSLRGKTALAIIICTAILLLLAGGYIYIVVLKGTLFNFSFNKPVDKSSSDYIAFYDNDEEL